MSDHTRPDHIAQQRVILTLPGMTDVTGRRGEPYRVADARALTMDLYYPADWQAGARIPAVVLATGFSDAGARKMFGCTFSEMGSFVSWAQLIAGSGLVAVTYINQHPAADLEAVVRYARGHAAELGIDETRLGVWACSGHGANVLSFLMSDARECFTRAALLYPYLVDLDGSTRVAEAARVFGFVHAGPGRRIEELARDVPIFIARAGQDRMPGLNDALDRFVAAALNANLPVTCVNHPEGPHAFDLFDDSEQAQNVVKQTLVFLSALRRSCLDPSRVVR